MSEPADEEVPQPPTTEMVEQETAKQVADGGEATVENQSQENETEIQEDKEESDPAENQVVEQHPEPDESENQGKEEQQPQSQQSHNQSEEPEKEDSQDTVKMPVADSPERALEDETMPSMVTISSISRVDESETYNKQDEDSKFVDTGANSPKQAVRQEKDSDSDSVCVILDDDEEDEQDEDNRNDHRRSRHDDEDEGESSYEDEYDGSSSYDSEDMDDDQYNEKYDKRFQRNVRRDNEEDEEYYEDEGEEEEEEDIDNEDEYMDEPDFRVGDGGSDDAVLRPNSNGLSKQQKERSASLQDLSLIQGSSPKTRHNVNPFSQKAIFERNQGKRKLYAHVESKVKKYIDDLAEQRRISSERRKKSIDDARQRNDEPTEIQLQRSEEVMMACQSIKNYAEKTLKEVAESEENQKMLFLQQGVENGEISLIPRQLVASHNVEIENKSHEMEIDLIEEDEEKKPTFNGTVPKENPNNFVTERKGILRRENGPPKSSILNGEDPLSFQPIDNLRTLSYDEYMRGSANEMNTVVINKVEFKDVQSIPVQNAELEDDSGLRIESVVSNYSSEKAVDDFQDRKTPPVMVNQSTETFYQENPETQNLRMQLNQRNQQFESLREAYQKTMADNMSMRMELENLRKAVAYYQEEQKSQVKTKMSAVQTETTSNCRDMPLIDLEGNEDPKLGVSAVSTQWSDSTGSVAAISMDPPNVTTALNSDESCQPPKTPIHKRNALSRAFMTSTKILQTLSSITYGKTKVDKHAKPPKTGETEKSSKFGPPNSKKRKASETMDDSTQPTKIPHLSKSNDQAESAPSTPEPQFVNPNFMEHESAGASTKEKTDERHTEDSTSEDDVKIYVYPEDGEGREHSFLIQAKEVSDNPKPGVRECGPYLLGNVEVYMTEVNGTINIWGKELSQTSQATTEDLDTSARSRDLRQNLRWQSTPRIFNKHEEGSASTSKKSRYLPKYAQPAQESHCEHSQRLSWPSCHEHQQRHYHSCCTSPPVIQVEAPCGCATHQKRTPGCCRAKSMPNVSQNCCCNGHKPLARRHSFNPTDEEDSDEEEVNRTLVFENCSSHSLSKSKLAHPCSTEQRRSTGSGSSTEPTGLCESESDPLIATRQVSEGFEGPEKKRKKKVRGLLMDLLKKGCVGDCRPMDKSNLQHTSIYEPSTSAQHRAPCLPNQPSYPQPAIERCSSCCKPDKTSEMEAQLERFREDMDKLRSQSDTLAGMIQALKSADIIN